MQLIGSVASPYVRRTRLLLVDVDYEFRDLAIYDADKAELARRNPTLKIPVLIDGETTLFDSRVIQRYLASRLGQAPLEWDEENQLTVIDGANDAFVALFLAARPGSTQIRTRWSTTGTASVSGRASTGWRRRLRMALSTTGAIRRSVCTAFSTGWPSANFMMYPATARWRRFTNAIAGNRVSPQPIRARPCEAN